MRNVFISLLFVGTAALFTVGQGCAADVGASDLTCVAGKACACTGTGSCARDCPGGGCNFQCTGAGSCDFRCAGGKCTSSSTGTGSTNLACPGGGCTMQCSGTGSCDLTECGSECKLTCSGTGTCKNHCADPTCS